MIGLLQRVTQARVEVSQAVVGEIGLGLMVLVCAERGDSLAQVRKLLDKLLAYRVFPDAQGRMNRSLADFGASAGLLLVPQFTLAADTNSGTRPSFTPAAEPALARELFEAFVAQARERQPGVATGVFGADMKVHLTNDGPVTFWLRVPPPAIPTGAST